MLSQKSFVTLIICVVSSLHFVRSQIEPQISYITPEQDKDVGGTASLKCTVQKTDDYSVVWMKVDRLRGITTTISTDAKLYIRNPRFSVNYDKASSTYSLQIKNIQEIDGGMYICQIPIDTETSVRKEVELQVRRPPFIVDKSTEPVRAREGDKNVRVECSANGYPPPNVTWVKESNGSLPSKENILRFQIVNRTDRGIYHCIADNGVGAKAMKKYVVEVEFAPVVTMAEPRVGQSLKWDMVLECHVEAYPSPVITWYKDGTKLVTNEHQSISQITKAKEYAEYTVSTIRLLSIEKPQYGRYECRAENELGKAQNFTELYETSKPVEQFRGEYYSSGTTVSPYCHPLILFLISGLFFKFISFF